MYLKSNRKQAKIQKRKYNYFKICTATPRSQQLIYKGEIQSFIKSINRKRKAQCTYQINNKRLRNATPRNLNLQEKSKHKLQGKN